jgi:2-oxoglutarate ferredoxin oxidoreductase subunit alpha
MKHAYRGITVRFCGIAGDGVVSSGKILGGACANTGLHVMVNDIYSAEIRGLGKSTSTVRFSTSKLYSMGDGIDLLVGMAAKESIVEIRDIKPEGGVIYDSSNPGDLAEADSLPAFIPPEINGYAVPLKRLANKASGTNQGKNIVSMGALCFLYELPPDMFINEIKRIFGRKGERIVEMNVNAFRFGYDYMKENYPLNKRFEIKPGLSPRALISGNDALGKGAMDCGLKFFAGYPITPATKIMEITAKELPKLGSGCLVYRQAGHDGHCRAGIVFDE